MFLPMVIDQTTRGERSYDIYSRLLEDRIVFVSGPIDGNMANSIIAQLLYLEGKDPKKDISMYINSPGGEISSGLAIYDTMNYIKCDVSTICMGMAASMASFLLAGGAKGKRMILPNGQVMIHQPLGATEGQATDIKVYADHMHEVKLKMATMLAENCGQPVDKVMADTERDNYLTAEQAREYGLVDKIITKR